MNFLVIVALLAFGSAAVQPAPSVVCNSFNPELVGEYASEDAAFAAWEAHGADDAMSCYTKE